MENRTKTAKSDRLTPPPGLSKIMRQWWNRLNDTYVFEDHDLHLLRLCCFAYDRAIQAKTILDKEGLTYLDRYGGYHPRPETVIEKQSRLDFAKLCKQLNLSNETPTPPGRRPGYSPK